MSRAELISSYQENPDNIPPPLMSTIYVELANGDHQVIHGITPQTFTRFSTSERHYNEEPYAVKYFEYRVRALEVLPYLRPFEPIDPYTAERLNLEIVMVANKKLIPECMKVRQRDFTPIGPIEYPGKSAHIDFTGISALSKKVDTKEAEVKAISMFNDIVSGDYRKGRTDTLHTTTVQRLSRNGFGIWLAPIRNQPLHVRVIDENIKAIIDEGNIPDPSLYADSAARLAELWHSHF